MSATAVLTGIVVAMLLFSTWQCLQLILREERDNDPTTQTRMMFLAGEHLLLTASVVGYYFSSGIYPLIVAAFVNSLAVCASYFVCELLVRGMVGRAHYHPGYSTYMASMELTYLNIYFMSYMYASVALIPSTLFILITEVLICHRRRQIEQCLEECLEEVGEEEVREEDCPICLLSLGEGDIRRIRSCRHVFHYECIREWLKYDIKCPLDRQEIRPHPIEHPD